MNEKIKLKKLLIYNNIFFKLIKDNLTDRSERRQLLVPDPDPDSNYM